MGVIVGQELWFVEPSIVKKGYVKVWPPKAAAARTMAGLPKDVTVLHAHSWDALRDSTSA